MAHRDLAGRTSAPLSLRSHHSGAREQLQTAIEEPAALVGLTLDPGLASTMITGVGTEPGGDDLGEMGDNLPPIYLGTP